MCRFCSSGWAASRSIQRISTAIAPALLRRSWLIRIFPTGSPCAYFSDIILLILYILRLGFAVASLILHTRLRSRNEFCGLPRLGQELSPLKARCKGGPSAFYP